MIFLNLGEACIPYIVNFIWDNAGDGPLTLPWSMVVYTMLSLLALYLTLVFKNDYSHG